MIKFLEPILERCWINFAIFLFSAIKVKNKLKFQIKVVSLDKKITIVGRFRWRHFLLTMHFSTFVLFGKNYWKLNVPVCCSATTQMFDRISQWQRWQRWLALELSNIIVHCALHLFTATSGALLKDI